HLGRTRDQGDRRASGRRMTLQARGSWSIPASHPTHPRIDIVRTDGSVAAGTPTAGATLADRLGAADVPINDVEFYVLVSAGSTSISDANVMPNLWTQEISDGIAQLEADLEDD